MESKQTILDALCTTLTLTDNAGFDGNPLVDIKYIKRSNGDEIARPIFKDGGGENGYYDINITGDSGTSIIVDVANQFIKKVW